MAGIFSKNPTIAVSFVCCNNSVYFYLSFQCVGISLLWSSDLGVSLVRPGCILEYSGFAYKYIKLCLNILILAFRVISTRCNQREDRISFHTHLEANYHVEFFIEYFNFLGYFNLLRWNDVPCTSRFFVPKLQYFLGFKYIQI